MTNDQLWRALGWEYVDPEAPVGTIGLYPYWRRGEDIRIPRQMPDYENDDAAAVGLLEELARLGYEPLVDYEGGWQFFSTTSGNTAKFPTFREAVVAGASALLGVTT